MCCVFYCCCLSLRSGESPERLEEGGRKIKERLRERENERGKNRGRKKERKGVGRLKPAWIQKGARAGREMGGDQVH